MTVTLELPPEIEQAYLVEAEARGLPLQQLVREILIQRKAETSGKTVFQQGLGLFASPDDAALLDEVVALAYEERRRG